MLKDLCFEVIQKCPNNCLFFSSCSSIEKENIISLKLFKNAIDYLISIGGIEEILLSGGEPLLHLNILETYNYLIKTKKLTFHVLSSII